MIIPEARYKEITRLMPIACVDLLVVNTARNVLLVKRNNSPAKEQWWFPGGRIWIGEERTTAAQRKLIEECGLHAVDFDHVGTYDLMFKGSDNELMLHAVTSLYKVFIDVNGSVRLDDQSREAKWLPVEEWLATSLHSFVHRRLVDFAQEQPYADDPSNT